jgi:peptidoglycan L-alanyl-D-glutamate endopeptidase CwlK
MLDPHGLLADVHPDLIRVVRAAAQTPVPFQVVYGGRTLAQEAAAVASGHSKTMHSRHIEEPADHLARAIDFCVIGSGGVLDWTVSDAGGGQFGHVAQQLQHAADTLGIPIQWGGASVGAWTPGVVSTFHDFGHVQLPWKQYP